MVIFKHALRLPLTSCFLYLVISVTHYNVIVGIVTGCDALNLIKWDVPQCYAMLDYFSGKQQNIMFPFLFLLYFVTTVDTKYPLCF